MLVQCNSPGIPTFLLVFYVKVCYKSCFYVLNRHHYRGVIINLYLMDDYVTKELYKKHHNMYIYLGQVYEH